MLIGCAAAPCCPAAGLVGLGDAEVVGQTASTLHAFNIPLVLASPRLAEMVTQEGNTLTTAPDMGSIVQVSVVIGGLPLALPIVSARLS